MSPLTTIAIKCWACYGTPVENWWCRERSSVKVPWQRPWLRPSLASRVVVIPTHPTVLSAFGPLVTFFSRGVSLAAAFTQKMTSGWWCRGCCRTLGGTASCTSLRSLGRGRISASGWTEITLKNYRNVFQEFKIKVSRFQRYNFRICAFSGMPFYNFLHGYVCICRPLCSNSKFTLNTLSCLKLGITVLLRSMALILVHAQRCLWGLMEGDKNYTQPCKGLHWFFHFHETGSKTDDEDSQPNWD